MVKDFKIILYQDGGDYYPGSDIRGAVVDKPKHYNSVVVELFGRADVHWKQSEGYDQQPTQTRLVTSSREVFYGVR